MSVYNNYVCVNVMMMKCWSPIINPNKLPTKTVMFTE